MGFYEAYCRMSEQESREEEIYHRAKNDALQQARNEQNARAARIAAENERINAENQRIYDDLLGKYNELAFDSHNLAAQRDEAVAIIKENIDKLPLSYEEARARILKHGYQVEQEQRKLTQSK